MMPAWGSLLRRRWALIAGLFLLMSVAWFAVWASGRPASRYLAEAQLALVDPRPVLSPEDLAPYLSEDSPAEYYLTPDGLLTLPDVYRGAAVVLEAVRKEEAPLSAGEWTRPSGGRIEELTKAAAFDEETQGAARALLEKEIEIRPADDSSGLVRVLARNRDPEEAQRMANAFAWSARRVAGSKADAVMAEIEAAYASRLESLRLEVELLKETAGEQEEQAADAEREIRASEASIAELTRRIDGTLADRDRLTLRVEALEAAEHRRRESLPAGPEEDGLTSPVLKRLRGDMDAIRISIAQEGLARTPEAPRYKDFLRRLAQLETAYREELDRVRARVILDLRRKMAGLDDELELLQDRQGVKRLEARAQVERLLKGRSTRDDLRRRSAELAHAETVGRSLKAGDGYHVLFGAAATRAAAETGPDRASPLWGILVVAALALLVGFLAERGDTRVRTDADVKRAVNLPGLAVVDELDEPVILRLHPQDPLAEDFAMAGTMLRSYLAEREFKSCVVTSAAAQEGKTTVAANLAVAMARKGLDVVLIDADLRRPRIHEVFGVDNGKGLSTLLSGEEESADNVMAPTEIPSLRILPSGPAPELPADLMESPRMGELHQTLREKFDVVLIDGPPATETGDGLALCRLADTNVWVIRSGQSDTRELGWARHVLGNVRADVAGVVLTFAPRRGGERFYAHPVSASR